MKIRVVSSKSEISKLNSDEKIVHLAFRPSDKDIFTLVKACPGVQAVHIPSSYEKTVSKSIRMFLDMKNIKILEGDVWGHRKDINEHYEIKSSVISKINDLKQKGLSEKEIIKNMKKDIHLSQDLVNFIISS